MRVKFQNGLVLIDILSILLLVIIAVLPSNVLRIILGVPFIFFFSGYSLVLALFPRKDAISHVVRATLSLALSIAVVPLIGMVLNYTPWGIRLYPVLVSVIIFIFACSAVALLRLNKLAPEDRFAFPLQFSLGEEPGASRVLSIVLIVAMVGAIGTFGYVLFSPKNGEKFTEFYLLGMEGKAINYPVDLKTGQAGQLIVGIINHEQAEVTYQVRIKIGETTTDGIGPLELKPEEKEEMPLSFTPVQVGNNQKVQFLLYKDGGSEPHLETHLWINVSG